MRSRNWSKRGEHTGHQPLYVTDLGRAYREGRLDRRLRLYLAPKGLIIDKMGYLPLDDLGATIFFQLVSARYDRGSIILASNKDAKPGSFLCRTSKRAAGQLHQQSRKTEFAMSFLRHGQIYKPMSLAKEWRQSTFGSDSTPIESMSLQLAISCQVALLQSLLPLHQAASFSFSPLEPVNRHHRKVGYFCQQEFSTSIDKILSSSQKNQVMIVGTHYTCCCREQLTPVIFALSSSAPNARQVMKRLRPYAFPCCAFHLGLNALSPLFDM